jgi:hypothetical protein
MFKSLYGLIAVDSDPSYIGLRDRNGDGVILQEDEIDRMTQIFVIINPKNGKYMIVLISYNNRFENPPAGYKLYKGISRNGQREQFIEDFESARSSILR